MLIYSLLLADGMRGSRCWQLSKTAIISDEVDGGQLSGEATIANRGASTLAEQCVQVQCLSCGHIGVLTADTLSRLA
jgi:hypothetical protein